MSFDILVFMHTSIYANMSRPKAACEATVCNSKDNIKKLRTAEMVEVQSHA